MPHRAGLDQATVIEAAARLIDEEGIEQLSLARLAERLGVRTPSLYNHVAGLAGLKQDLAVHCSREVLARLTRAAVGKAGTEAIFSIADAYRDYALHSAGRYALTLQSPQPDNQELQDIARQIIEVVQAILAPYKLSEEQSIHAIRGLRSIIQGFVSLEVRGGFGLPTDLNSSFHWLIGTFIAGLEQQNSTT
ncbi:MAG: WHG domain-containing protein [Ktedonobacteraceae bacterium]|nr:WHG domain-containing protein [Ktedonobacteraceae bacterium]